MKSHKRLLMIGARVVEERERLEVGFDKLIYVPMIVKLIRWRTF